MKLFCLNNAFLKRFLTVPTILLLVAVVPITAKELRWNWDQIDAKQVAFLVILSGERQRLSTRFRELNAVRPVTGRVGNRSSLAPSADACDGWNRAIVDIELLKKFRDLRPTDFRLIGPCIEPEEENLTLKR